MRTIKITTWLDSGANNDSTFETEFEINEAEWNAMSDEEKHAYAKTYSWDRADWGWFVSWDRADWGWFVKEQA